ncbi:SPFH domain-containing protein [Hydrogenimonas sp.]
MGFFDWLRGQFIDVIEWTDAAHDTMVWRFPNHGHEIKYGSKLIVRSSQTAIFVNEGKIADILGPGIYELETKNLPLLTSLQHWDHGFSSPFKAEVYFLNMTRFTDLKWGTRTPVLLRDPDLGTVQLRAYGTYEICIDDPKTFLLQVVGTDRHFILDEIKPQLTNLIVSKFPVLLGTSDLPLPDLAANYTDLSERLTLSLAPEFHTYGLKLEKFMIENISLSDKVERTPDRRSKREIGNQS